MPSQVEICNIALSNIGDERISDLADSNARARACNERYLDVRDAVLRAHPWNCASFRHVCERSVGTPVWGYNYSYILPTDCLRLLEVKEYEYPYKTERRLILSDSPELNILYISNRSGIENLFDSQITQSVALRLAYEIAEDLTGRTNLKEEMWRKYQLVMAEAKHVDASESTPQIFEADYWINSRVAGSGAANKVTPTSQQILS